MDSVLILPKQISWHIKINFFHVCNHSGKTDIYSSLDVFVGVFYENISFINTEY